MPHQNVFRAAFAGVLMPFTFGACSGVSDPSAEEPVTVWILPGATYHLASPSAAPTTTEELEQRLREALSGSSAPAFLAVRAVEGTNGYDYLVAKGAACRAGVSRIDFAGELPFGSDDPNLAPTGFRGIEEVGPPCPGTSGQPDQPLSQTPA